MIGAGLENGFGFQLAEDIDQTTLTVTGSHITAGYITLDGNGVESGQSKTTIIVFDNANNEMTSPGGIGVNTTPGLAYVTPVSIEIHIAFPADTYTSADLDIPNFNPFLIVNQNRGIEVHLPDYLPTDLVDDSYFGTVNDDSDPTIGNYYKTENNLPWAINIYESFDYPTEKTSIENAYLKFVDWATSSGGSFDDWYQDINGYRNESNIYVIPSK
jgi:LruC domain-containing protein